MEHSVHRVAELAGVTSRTLRHYDTIGLLHPTRVGENGYRYYDETALVRLQRILLLRGLGLRLDTIARVLEGDVDDVTALEDHVQLLEREGARIQDQLRSVRSTIEALRKDERPMAETMFDGFDQSQYEDEVRERWGDKAADSASGWWKGLRGEGQSEFLARHTAMQDDYDRAIDAGEDAAGAVVQQIAERHYLWIVDSWQGKRPDAAALRGLADMYVGDPRFAANYTRSHAEGAEFVRDALYAYAQRNLEG